MFVDMNVYRFLVLSEQSELTRVVFAGEDGGTCPGHWTSESPLLELIQTSLGGTHVILLTGTKLSA